VESFVLCAAKFLNGIARTAIRLCMMEQFARIAARRMLPREIEF
jgi:hypothetical protein